MHTAAEITFSVALVLMGAYVCAYFLKITLLEIASLFFKVRELQRKDILDGAEKRHTTSKLEQ